MFTFEPLTREDLPFLLEVRNDCRDCLHDNRPFTLEQCEKWFLRTKPDFHVIRHDGERIGYFRLSNLDPANGGIYVGADLHPRFRGKGFGRLAYQAFLPLLKERYGVASVKLEVLSHNTVAHRLYEKLGFIEIGRKTNFAIRDGRPVDSIIMQLNFAS